MNRRRFLKSIGLGAATLVGTRWATGADASTNRPNVLFICVDDLRPQLACYGNPMMHTPNLDRLAREGVVFNNHFVQVPTCGASRHCLLTGTYPSRPQHLGNGAFESLPREDIGHAFSMPQHFRENGYTTVSIGKVSHNPSGRRYGKPTGKLDADGNMTYAFSGDNEPELALAWDRVGVPTGEWGNPWDAFFGYAGGGTRSYTKDKSPAVEAADVPDTGYPDGLIAEEALKELNRLKDEPFFLAVGFYKPHLPFNAPKKYWDLYNREDIPLAPHPAPPENVDTAISLHRNGELTGRYEALKDPTDATPDEARRLRHGYFACVSYVDAQIGKVLDELGRLDLRKNTVVVVWGDHGWHLGDLHVWGKHTAFEWSMRSALLVSAPGAAANAHTQGLVEAIDLYPTLADLCALPEPPKHDGASFAQLLRKPDSKGKDAACGFWRMGGHLARTMRTPDYRITRWTRNGKTGQVELYDHRTDPGETVNIAEEKPELCEELLKRLEERGLQIG